MVKKRLPEAVRAYFRKEGARGGKLGGAQSWAHLTPAERTARATKASKAAALARTKKKQAKKGTL